jgi:hypothetical protein
MKSLWDKSSDHQKERWTVDVRRFIKLHITTVEIYARTNFTNSEDAAKALAARESTWELLEEAFDVFTKEAE